MALAGGLYLFLVSGRLLGGRYEAEEREGAPAEIDPAHIGSAQIGDASLFEVKRPLQPLKAAIALVTFVAAVALATMRSEEHTSELQSLMRISYAVFCLKKKTIVSLPCHHQ